MTTAMAMYKAVKIVEKEYPDGCTKTEAVKLAWKYFLLPGGVTLATMASILSGALISNKRQASILAAYAVLKKGYSEYRKQVKEVIGAEQEKEVYEKAKADINIDCNNGKECLFYDELSGRYFNLTMEDLIHSFLWINRELTKHGHVSLNELYYEWNIPPSEDSDALGWSLAAGFHWYGYNWIDFDLVKTPVDDMVCYIVSIEHGPTLDYLNVE